MFRRITSSRANQMLLSQRNHSLFLFREKKNVSRNKGTNNNFKKKKEQQIPTRATARKKCVHKERPKRTQFAILLQKKRNLFAKRLTGAKSHWSLFYWDLSNIVNRKRPKEEEIIETVIFTFFFFLKYLSVCIGT